MNHTPKQSHYILQGLLAQGRIDSNDVAGVLLQLKPEIEQLKTRLKTLQELKTEVKHNISGGNGRNHPQRIHVISKEGRNTMRDNSIYANFLRWANPQNRQRIQAERSRQGVIMAITFARKLVGNVPAAFKNKVMVYVSKTGRITRSEAAKLTGESTFKAGAMLRQLAKQKILIMRGQRRGAHYVVSKRSAKDERVKDERAVKVLRRKYKDSDVAKWVLEFNAITEKGGKTKFLREHGFQYATFSGVVESRGLKLNKDKTYVELGKKSAMQKALNQRRQGTDAK